MTSTPDQIIHHKIPYITKIFFPTAILTGLYTNYVYSSHYKLGLANTNQEMRLLAAEAVCDFR